MKVITKVCELGRRKMAVVKKKKKNFEKYVNHKKLT